MSDKNGWTVVHCSAKSGRYKLIQFFTVKQSDINTKTKARENCLHIAAANGYLNLCKILIGTHFSDVHITDNDGWAAFHHSVRSGSYELITFSTDMGSDINLRANDGTNCLHIAACYGHLNLCKTLIEKHDFDVNMTANGGWTRQTFYR